MPYMRDGCTESRSTESQKESIYVLPLTIYKRNSYKRSMGGRMRDINLWVVRSPTEAITNSIEDRLWGMHSWKVECVLWLCTVRRLICLIDCRALVSDDTTRHNTFLSKWMSSRQINHKGDISIFSKIITLTQTSIPSGIPDSVLHHSPHNY